jgi:hypothetical protein
MKIVQKILVIAVSIFFHCIVVSMEESEFNYADAIVLIQKAKQANNEMHTLLEIQTKRIIAFSQDTDHNPEHMKEVGIWLNTQRKNISEESTWNGLINVLLYQVWNNSSCGRLCKKYATTCSVARIIDQIAKELKPGQDCLEELIQRSQEQIILESNQHYEKCPHTTDMIKKRNTIVFNFQ